MQDKETHHSKSIHINKSYITYGIFLALSFLPIIRLITQTYLKGDAGVFTGNLDFEEYFGLWNEDRLGAARGIDLWLLFPIGAIYSLLDLIGAPANVLQATVIGILFFIGIVSFNALIKRLLNIPKHSVAAVVGAIFYMYNPYVTLTLGGTFQFLIAYALAPLFFLIFISYIQQRSMLKLLLGGVVLSFIFGPNFVFGAIVLLLCFIYLTYMHINEFRQLLTGVLSLGFMTIISFLLSAWWLIPLLTVAFFDAGASSDVLTSESFYNLDSSTPNVLRGLGDWSFFGKHLGQPYFGYSQYFLDNIFIIIGSFVPLGLLFYLTIVKKNRSEKRLVGFFALTFLVTIVAVGGTHSDWFTSNLISFLFDNFKPLLIFRNTYKLMSIGFLILGLIVALSVFKIRKSHNSKLSWLVIVLLFLPSFPVALNLTLQDISLLDKYPEYWSQASSRLNSDPEVKRVLLLPDQYFSVYDWSDEISNVGGDFEASLIDAQVVQNTCAGCAYANSADITELLVQRYENPTYSNALQLLAITHVLQRNDYATSFYPSIDKKEKVNDALAKTQGIGLVETIGELDLYKVQDPLEQLYSPELLIKTAPSDLFNVFRKFKPQDKIALVEEENPFKDGQLNAYRSVYYNYSDIDVQENAISETLDISKDREGSTVFTLDNPDALLNTPGQTASYVLSGDEANERSTLTTNFEGLDGAQGFSLGDNLVQGTEIKENHTYSAGNCRKFSADAVLAAQTTIDPEISQPVINLSASKDMGCISFGTKGIEQDSEFMLQLEYKVNEGGYFGYCLSFDGTRCDQTEIIDSEDSSWGTYNVIFNTDKQLDYGSTRVYIYAPAIYGEQSNVFYKAPALKKVISKPSFEITTNQKGKVSVASDISLGKREFIPDNNFSQGEWGSEDKSCALILDDSKYKTNINKSNDSYVLRLESSNTTACSSSPRFAIENSSTYVFSAEVRVESGEEWGYCIYSGLSCISTEYATAENDGWNRYYFLFDGLPSEKNLRLYLYSSRTASESVVEFRDTSIKRVLSHKLPRFSSSNSELKTLDQVKFEELNKVSPSHYDLSFSMPINGASSIVLQQSFSPAWKLIINGEVLSEENHFLANTYANAWRIDAKELCDSIGCRYDNERAYFLASIEFEPQKYGRIAVVISVASYGLLVVALSIILFVKYTKEDSKRG